MRDSPLAREPERLSPPAPALTSPANSVGFSGSTPCRSSSSPSSHSCSTTPAPANPRCRCYCGYVLLWSTIITAGGAVVGAVVFPLVGSLAGMEMTATAMALSGARQLGFLTFIWAVGIAIVMAFQHAHRQRLRGTQASSRSK
jgi:hypothetical protein